MGLESNILTLHCKVFVLLLSYYKWFQFLPSVHAPIRFLNYYIEVYYYEIRYPYVE